MKYLYQGCKYLFWAGILALPSLALAGEGDGKGNGGDPLLLREKFIKKYVNSELRNDALAYMSSLQLDTIANPKAQKALKRMLEKDILGDIRMSSYVIQSSCRAIGGQDAGGAYANDLGGDICLSAKRLAEVGATKAEIVGLVLHEHAHHFGYVDADNAIYEAVFATVKLSNPAWGGESATPSPLPTSISGWEIMEMTGPKEIVYVVNGRASFTLCAQVRPHFVPNLSMGIRRNEVSLRHRTEGPVGVELSPSTIQVEFMANEYEPKTFCRTIRATVSPDWETSSAQIQGRLGRSRHFSVRFRPGR